MCWAGAVNEITLRAILAQSGVALRLPPQSKGPDNRGRNHSWSWLAFERNLSLLMALLLRDGGQCKSSQKAAESGVERHNLPVV